MSFKNKSFRKSACGVAAAAAALVSLMGASTAHAQSQSSNVSIYGQIDAGVDHVSNVSGSRANTESTGVLAPNILGFKGQEDLGNGLKAFFDLQTQFDLDDGATTSTDGFWNRRSVVGLSSPWGSMTMGTQEDFMFSSLNLQGYGADKMFPYISLMYLDQGPYSNLTPTGSFDFDHLADGTRTSNSIRYDSPNLHGLTFGAMYGFGEQSGAMGKDNTVSLGANYHYGPLNIGLAGTRQRRSDINDGNDGILTEGTNIRWDFANQSSLSFVFTHTKNTYSKAAVNVWKGVYMFPASPRIRLLAGYTYMDGNDELGNVGTHQVNASVHYLFSKRTQVYATAAVQQAVGGTVDENSAQIMSTSAASSDQHQHMIRFGMFHAF